MNSRLYCMFSLGTNCTSVVHSYRKGNQQLLQTTYHIEFRSSKESGFENETSVSSFLIRLRLLSCLPLFFSSELRQITKVRQQVFERLFLAVSCGSERGTNWSSLKQSQRGCFQEQVSFSSVNILSQSALFTLMVCSSRKEISTFPSLTFVFASSQHIYLSLSML